MKVTFRNQPDLGLSSPLIGPTDFVHSLRGGSGGGGGLRAAGGFAVAAGVAVAAGLDLLAAAVAGVGEEEKDQEEEEARRVLSLTEVH